MPAICLSLSMASSRRLRSCITFWLFSGCDQKSGAEICSSVEASSFFFFGASKITPHGGCLFTERRVFAVEFVESHYYSGKFQFSNARRIRLRESACSRHRR